MDKVYEIDINTIKFAALNKPSNYMNKPGSIDRVIQKSLRSTKEVASYVSTIIRDPKNYFEADGRVIWDINISIFDDINFEVIRIEGLNVWMDRTPLLGTKIYPAAQYIFQSILNARQEVIDSIRSSQS